jgi:hypothetical protein
MPDYTVTATAHCHLDIILPGELYSGYNIGSPTTAHD